MSQAQKQREFEEKTKKLKMGTGFELMTLVLQYKEVST
jgi:hypothetical protein